MQDKNNAQINDGVNPDNQWIKDIVIEKYKYYGFEEHIGLNYDFPFMEETKGDIDFNNKKWTCVNWYIGNLNAVHRDLLNRLEMFSKEQVKEQIMFAYNKQVQEFNDWDFRKGVYVEYYNIMESISKSLGSYTPNGYYDIYRLKWLFISACFIKFYKVILDRYFPEQLEQTIDIPPHQTLSIEPTYQAEGSEQKPELTQREIALIYWYDRDNLSIDLNSSQQIAEYNGYQSPTSGRSLYIDHYTKVRDKAEERTDNATSEKYLNNIIPRLTTERGKREANEDLTKAKCLKENKKKGLFY